MPLSSASLQSKLLLALHGKNQGAPPIWLMRQAGRYLPEYRALRQKYPLRELFFTPELAAEVTLMPLRRFAFDAAILFSDITVVLEALSFPLDFNDGPVLRRPFHLGMPLFYDLAPLAPMIETLKILKKELTVPLIGFAGAPFTVASYLIGDLEETKEKMEQDPALLYALADVTVEYLRLQMEAGVDAIQVFDSWANCLTPDQWRRWTLPFLDRVAKAFPVPLLFFMRGGGRYLDQIPCGISLDWETDLKQARQRTSRPLQGNLNPDLLLASPAQIRTATTAILAAMHNDPAFIFNLGHGIKPTTPLDSVSCLLDTIRSSTNTTS